MKVQFYRLFSAGLLLLSGSAAFAHPNHSIEREGLAHQFLSLDHWLPSLLVLLWVGMGVTWALSFVGRGRKAAID